MKPKERVDFAEEAGMVVVQIIDFASCEGAGFLDHTQDAVEDLIERVTDEKCHPSLEPVRQWLRFVNGEARDIYLDDEDDDFGDEVDDEDEDDGRFRHLFTLMDDRGVWRFQDLLDKCLGAGRLRGIALQVRTPVREYSRKIDGFSYSWGVTYVGWVYGETYAEAYANACEWALERAKEDKERTDV